QRLSAMSNTGALWLENDQALEVTRLQPWDSSTALLADGLAAIGTVNLSVNGALTVRTGIYSSQGDVTVSASGDLTVLFDERPPAPPGQTTSGDVSIPGYDAAFYSPRSISTLSGAVTLSAGGNVDIRTEAIVAAHSSITVAGGSDPSRAASSI